MCLAVPGRVIDVTREHGVLMGRVDFGGVVRQACLEHVPETQKGDYVLVHVGFALSRIDEHEAARIFTLLAELGESMDAGADVRS
jgi:hydrogenase expression/formation protein HypC